LEAFGKFLSSRSDRSNSCQPLGGGVTPEFQGDQQETIDRFTHGIIRRKIMQLVGRVGLTEDDSEDLEQDFILRVLQSLWSFDPSRGHRNKFITTVVERYVANILRNRQAGKRDYRRVDSSIASEPIDDEPIDWEQTIEEYERDARYARRRRRQLEIDELANDIADVISKLPPDLREFAERLKFKSISEIARDLKVPRTTLYGKLRRLRIRFEKASLNDYL
jgi:RNA polymerase sigma-70 factor (ECF subfamily)